MKAEQLKSIFEMAIDEYIRNFYRFGYEIDAVVEDNVPKLVVATVPEGYPKMSIITVAEDEKYVFDVKLNFSTVSVIGQCTDSIEFHLNELARLGKYITQLQQFVFNPMSYEVD